MGLNSTVSIQKDIAVLDTLFSGDVDFLSKNLKTFYDGHTSWGTYELHNDTIKTFLIDDVSGAPETRKNVISSIFLISKDKQIKQIYISNASKDRGYKKFLDIPPSTFHPIKNKKDSTACPYLKEDWFYGGLLIR